jgi:hypothetical protein
MIRVCIIAGVGGFLRQHADPVRIRRLNQSSGFGGSVNPMPPHQPNGVAPDSARCGIASYAATAMVDSGAPTGRRVMVNVMTAPMISSAPASRKALVKLPVAATM